MCLFEEPKYIWLSSPKQQDVLILILQATVVVFTIVLREMLVYTNLYIYHRYEMERQIREKRY